MSPHIANSEPERLATSIAWQLMVDRAWTLHAPELIWQARKAAWGAAAPVQKATATLRALLDAHEAPRPKPKLMAYTDPRTGDEQMKLE